MLVPETLIASLHARPRHLKDVTATIAIYAGRPTNGCEADTVYVTRKTALHFVAATMAVLLGLTPASAQLPDKVMKDARAYVVDSGFLEVDLDAWPLVEDLDSTLSDSGLARRDADITALEKALLLIDMAEPPLPRVRYAVRLSQRTEGHVPISLVEVHRFNLGPAIRAETAESYGEENTADADVFGVGPHVAWRYAMQPSTKASAILLAAGRKEVADADAEDTSCFGRGCLSLDTADDLKPWVEAPPQTANLPALPYAAIIASGSGENRQEEEVPAAIALSMAVAMGLAMADSDGVMWTAGDPDTDSPHIVLVIDRNTGQEIMTEAVMGVAKIGKDDDERWLRRTGGVFDGAVEAFFQTATGPMP